jgi:hypothetical protein
MKTLSPSECSAQPFRVLDEDWALSTSDRSVLGMYAPGEPHRAFWGEVLAVGVAE